MSLKVQKDSHTLNLEQSSIPEEEKVLKVDASHWKKFFIALVILGAIGLVLAGICGTNLYAQHHQLSNVFAAIPSPWPIVMTVIGGVLVIGGIIGVVQLVNFGKKHSAKPSTPTNAEEIPTDLPPNDPEPKVIDNKSEQDKPKTVEEQFIENLPPNRCGYVQTGPDAYTFCRKGAT